MTQARGPAGAAGAGATGPGERRAGDAVTGRWWRAPASPDARRLAEGGRRLAAEPGGPAPRVSVITVCRNAAATLAQTLDSLAAQSFRDFEHLVIDGASDDGTQALLHARAEAIEYFVSEPDGGIYAAMNKGLALARGQAIVVLNADDWFEPQALERLVAALDAGEADFVSAQARYVLRDGQAQRVPPLSPFDAATALRMPLRHGTMLIPAAVYERAGPYDTAYRVIADRVFAERLYRLGLSHRALPEVLLNFRISGVSSVDLDTLYRERVQALRAHFPGLDPSALRDLADIEHIGPARLAAIARGRRDPAFRAAAVDYARDRAAQGAEGWRGFDVRAFYPAFDAVPPGPATEVPQGRDPAVSVIVPVHSAEATLARCLDSLLAQTLSDIEILCIDDASPDRGAAILADYAARDARLRLLPNQHNVGLGSSRNRGVRLARGRYVFHVDPDDTVPPEALETLWHAAERDGCDMVRGSFLQTQTTQGEATAGAPRRKGLPEGAPPLRNVTLATHPELAATTEGHWSWLYRRAFARRVFYPEDLTMGQDSLFLVRALTAARRLSVLPEVVYHYRANPASAMNRYTPLKLLDEVEWRDRAARVLAAAGLATLGTELVAGYWNLPFFETVAAQHPADRQAFWRRMLLAQRMAGNGDLAQTRDPVLRGLLARGLATHAAVPAPAVAPADGGVPLRIEVIATTDTGGAGLAALRSAEGLRAAGHEVRLSTLLPRHQAPWMWTLPLAAPFQAEVRPGEGGRRALWSRHVEISPADAPGLVAREMVSRPGSLVDPRALAALVEQADIVHLHWVPGVIDPATLAEVVGDRPVFWTLHDMNPFTGGCHYSEGCTGFRQDCHDCPLFGGEAPEIARAFEARRHGLARVRDLHLVAPSDWMAGLARDSAMLRDRPVHVLPNILPRGPFRPIDKQIARRRLGLPQDRPLVAFGADHLASLRKGGDLMAEALRRLARLGDGRARAVVFGSGELPADLPVHAMGYVHDPGKLALIYAAADVFAFPSREDNAPQTVIEAMLCATPVVGFRVGNLPDLIVHGETGWLADPGDVEGFARGLVWALDGADRLEGLLRSMRAHGAAHVYSDPEAATARLVEVYRAALAKPGPAGHKTPARAPASAARPFPGPPVAQP